MFHWKFTTLVELILFVIGSLFLWFRNTDGTGAQNTLEVKLISLLVWCLLFFILFIIQVVWIRILKKKANQNH